VDTFETIKEYVETRLEQLDLLIEEFEEVGGPGASYEVALVAKQTLGDVYLKMIQLTQRPKIEDLEEGF
jgi:hypothetical protein